MPVRRIWGERRVVGKSPFGVLSPKTYNNFMTAKINVPIDDRTLTRKTILLVEDDRDDEELTRRALLKSNIRNEVVVAHDGQEALDLLFGGPGFLDNEPDHLPAVVLLDLKLPKVNGIEVLRKIRSDARTRRLPVVVLSSSRLERDRDAVYDLGANSFITKPVDFEKFCEAVGQLGMYWVLLNEQPPVREVAKEVAG
jgi:two-component system, response regulator